MRHRIAGRKLGRTTSHRWAMFRNMAHSLVAHGRIQTTLNNARELRPFADHLVTLGKKGSLAARRQAFWFVRSETMVKKLFSEVAPLFKDRQGGYSRILKLGYRLGDSSPMALIEYVDFPASGKNAPKKTKAEKKAESKAVAEKKVKAPKVKKEKPAKKEKVAPPKAKKEKAAPKKAAKKVEKKK